jgi:hypothetical protein
MVQEKSKYSCQVRMMRLHVHGVHRSLAGKSSVDMRARKVASAALLKKPVARFTWWYLRGCRSVFVSMQQSALLCQALSARLATRGRDSASRRSHSPTHSL